MYGWAELLIDHGVKVNMPTESFDSPMTPATCGGIFELDNLLIEKYLALENVND